jgi:hypothetical protein
MTFNQIADREVHERHVEVVYDVAYLLAVVLITLSVILSV